MGFGTLTWYFDCYALLVFEGVMFSINIDNVSTEDVGRWVLEFQCGVLYVKYWLFPGEVSITLFATNVKTNIV